MHNKNNMLNKHAYPILLFMGLVALPLGAFAQQGHLFSGKVTDTRSRPVAGATIYLLNTPHATVADSLGHFRFERIAAGNYTVQVSAAGFAVLGREVQVGAAATAPVHFILLDAAVQLDAVVVSAQKREESLQKVPLSITALSAKQVQEYRLWNSKELTAIVPNLYAANPGDDRNVTAIRGIATTSYDPAIATYIDGVNQFSLDTYMAQLWDVERIEVLRGPQGTLYGRNAMGGVINVITKQPGNATTGFAELTAGNFGQLRINAGIRTPVIKNKLFAGAALAYQKRDGFYTNDFYKRSFDEQYTVAGNYYLKYQAVGGLQLALNVKHQHHRNKGAFPLVNGATEALANPFHLSQNAVATMVDNTLNVSLTASRSGKNFDFSAQTAYQQNRRYYNQPLDGDFSPIDGITIINDYPGNWNRVKVLTQELRLHSPAAAAKRIKWTAGSYLFFQDNPTKQAVRFGKDAAFVGAPDINFSIINATKAKSYGLAFYGQVRYAVTQHLHIIGGLRYDAEKKTYAIRGDYQKDPAPNPVFATRPDTSARIRFHAFSPKLGIACAIGKHSDLFATYSRGYRTGGLTALSSDPSQPPLYPYLPEYSNNMELGIKHNLFDHRLQLNITAFYTLVTDAQVPTLLLPDAVTVTKNAGRLSSRGIELELAAKPARGLQLDYHVGYTHAKYQNLKLSQNGTAVNLSGKRQIFTPATTSMLALQYSCTLGGRLPLQLVARGEWMHLGKQYFDLANTIAQNGYGLLNARLGVSLKRWALLLWARNLGDKKYLAYAYDFGAVHLGNPKTMGLSVSVGL
jgi:iron complex outermembrane recepter protein